MQVAADSRRLLPKVGQLLPLPPLALTKYPQLQSWLLLVATQ